MRSIALVLFLLLLLRGLILGAPQPGEQDPSLAIRNGSRAPRVIVGRVLADARQFDPGCFVLLEVQRLDGWRQHGRTELQWRQCGIVLRQGWRVRAVGDLRQPAAGVHPFLPGAAERLASRGSWSQLRVSELEVLERPWTPLADGRRSIAQRMQRLAGPERGGLLAALVLGGAQVPLPDSMRQSFRVAGLSHALAASGFHLSVLLGAALSIGRLLPRSGRLAFAALALACFLMLAGPQPSVVRAVLMGGIALLIRESGERSRGFGVLLLTLNGMLLLHPAWARSLGFQLSAAATAGLMLTAPGLEQALIQRLPRRCRWLAPALSVPLAAMAWTLPLQLLHFGSTPLYALPANLLAAPLLAPLTLSAIALALGVLVLPPGVLQLLCWPVQQLAGALIVLVNWIISWPPLSCSPVGRSPGWYCSWPLLCCPGCCRPRSGPDGRACCCCPSLLDGMSACNWRMGWSPSIAMAGTGCWPATADVPRWWSAMQTRPAAAWPASSWMVMAINGWTGYSCWIQSPPLRPAAGRAWPGMFQRCSRASQLWLRGNGSSVQGCRWSCLRIAVSHCCCGSAVRAGRCCSVLSPSGRCRTLLFGAATSPAPGWDSGLHLSNAAG